MRLVQKLQAEEMMKQTDKTSPVRLFDPELGEVITYHQESIDPILWSYAPDTGVIWTIHKWKREFEERDVFDGIADHLVLTRGISNFWLDLRMLLDEYILKGYDFENPYCRDTELTITGQCNCTFCEDYGVHFTLNIKRSIKR